MIDLKQVGAVKKIFGCHRKKFRMTGGAVHINIRTTGLYMI